MLNDSLKTLLGHKNANTFFGWAPGTLVIVDYRAGGGFAGAPQELTIAPVQPDREYPAVSFPFPGPGLEYHIGGRSYCQTQPAGSFTGSSPGTRKGG